MKVKVLLDQLSKNKKAVRIGVVSALALTIAVTSTVILKLNSGSGDDELIARSTIVKLGNIQSTITGSGALTPANRVTLSAPGTTTITKLPYKVGDMVKKGQLIFALDDTEATQNVFQNQDNLSQSQSDLEATEESINSLNITAPCDGVITSIAVSGGDTIQKNAQVLTLTNNSTYKLSVTFNEEDAKNIQLGDNAEVYIQSLMSSVSGTVSYKGNSAYAATNGSKLRDIDIQINNPGSLEEGLEATAEITKGGASFSSINSGKLSSKLKYNLKCEAGGTVKRVNVRLNQFVHSGQLLVSVQNDDLVRSAETGQSKLKTQQDQLKYSKEQKEKYVAYAPIDGEIVTEDCKLGDSVKQGDSVVVIADVSKMEFSVPIDELDISKIGVGQEVNVTVDALTQTSYRPLSGIVSKIAPEGTSTNGVSTYPVTISVSGNYASNVGGMSGNRRQTGSNGFGTNRTFPSGGSGNGRFQGGASGTASYGGRAGRSIGNNSSTSDRGSTSGYRQRNSSDSQLQGGNGSERTQGSVTLLSGMNANADIVISGKSNVLSVPLEAVQRFEGKSYVMVKSTKAKVEKLKKSGKYVDIFANQSSGQQSRSQGSSNTNKGNGNNLGSRNNGNSMGRTQAFNSVGNNEQLKEYYSTAIPTEIEVGVNNSENIEVISGLKEGQEIMLPPIIKSSSTQNTNTSGMNGLGNGIGGFGGSGFGGSGMGGFSGGANRNRYSGNAGRN